jgi:hypothetical protein
MGNYCSTTEPQPPPKIAKPIETALTNFNYIKNLESIEPYGNEDGSRVPASKL